ncbi:hypothetical protein LCGC14_0317840 [marine sediment metagenome]|uniref:Uncharacterized protein n=1 Tax=marine sediment metagenome TaxID=412755 RepID=A0A0F9TJX6_9ZZZZ
MSSRDEPVPLIYWMVLLLILVVGLAIRLSIMIDQMEKMEARIEKIEKIEKMAN